MRFARQHARTDPKTVVFSDESWFSCNENTCKIQWAVKRADVFPRESKARVNVAAVQVWAAVGWNYKSELIIFPSHDVDGGEERAFRLNADRYVRRCLVRVVPDVMRLGRIFQHDGARAHASKKTIAYLRRKGVRVMEDWPANSPDFNMIEYIWKTLKERVGLECPMDMGGLVTALRKAWSELPQALINRHVLHFPNALKNV